MNARRRLALWIVVTAQFVVLAGMIAEKDQALATGTHILLATAPVDPVDLLRGDYISLRYEISAINCNRVACSEQHYEPGTSVYVELAPDERGVWHARSVSSTVPSAPGGVYVKGQLLSDFKYIERTVNVNYGIESYYVAEHHGQVSGGQFSGGQVGRGRANPMQPLQVEIVVPASHYAQLKQLYWNGKPLLP